jgi:hypothetical protein
MSALVKKWMVLVSMAFVLMSSLLAQGGPCAPLAPPSWITITNIKPLSAYASWQNVAPGAWYRVELKNLNSGLVEDLVVTQATSRSYMALSPGTHYQVRIQASSCSVGAFGAPAFKDFYTPTIIIDEVVFLDDSQHFPNQQNAFAPADILVPQSNFIICVYKVPDIQNIDEMNDVFHAFIQLDNGDFFEFLLVGSQDNKIHYTYEPLAFPREKWSYEALNANGGSILIFPGTEAVTIKVKYRTSPNMPQWVDKMTLSTTGMLVQPNVLPLAASIAEGVEFYASSNNSTICTPGANAKHAADQNSDSSDPETMKFALSPNPFTDHLDLNIANGELGPVTIRVLDLAGRVQFETTYSDAATTAHRIDTDVWLPGLYFLQIQTEAGTRTEPIVKL